MDSGTFKIVIIGWYPSLFLSSFLVFSHVFLLPFAFFNTTLSISYPLLSQNSKSDYAFLYFLQHRFLKKYFLFTRTIVWFFFFNKLLSIPPPNSVIILQHNNNAMTIGVTWCLPLLKQLFVILSVFRYKPPPKKKQLFFGLREWETRKNQWTQFSFPSTARNHLFFLLLVNYID